MFALVNFAGVNLPSMWVGVNIDSMTNSGSAKRETPYHHGDLRNALVRAAAELAEHGGPEAVTVRAAARKVGVTPTAAYRHFTNHEQLLGAAQEQAQASLLGSMSEAVNSLAPESDPIDRLNAAGRGYIAFATREPGLFRTAFCESPFAAEPSDDDAFGLLAKLLDDLVQRGYMDPAHRPHAEIMAWSAVHGLASLLIDGALSWLDDDAREQAIAATLDGVQRGLATAPNAAGTPTGTTE